MTFRQLIDQVQAECPEKLFAYLFARDKECMRGEITMERTTRAYSQVIQELLKKPRTRAYKYPIFVKMTRQDDESHPDVSLLNTKAVPAPKGKRPWGGKTPPKGHYNCNLEKYSAHFAFGYTGWSQIIDTPVINRARLKNCELLAVILQELTFHGWSEEQCNDSVQVLKKKLEEARKDIKAGRCTVLPKKGDKGFDVVIPDSVRDSLKNRES